MRQLLVVLVTALYLLALPAQGQETATKSAAEVLAQDLHEEVLRFQATVKDMSGRQETKPVPVTIYRPPGDGPFPLFVLNHGRAVEAKRAQQGRYRPEPLARYLVAKGFVVMVPNRIGYWETYGGFDPEYSGCRSIEPMSMAASDQVLATVSFARTLPYVDGSRWLVGGVSVGGLTSVATVGRAPEGLLGGINFSGGTGGNPDMDRWLPVVDQFLHSLGFDAPAIVQTPPASGFAEIADAGVVPVGNAGRAAYAKFLEMAMPRAFAASGKGSFGFARGDYAAGRALGNCQRYGNPCKLYAVGEDVVWKP